MSRKEVSEERKQEIFGAYLGVLLDKGVEGASIARIASRIDIHPSLIIHYFKNKDNLTIKLMQYLIDRYEQEILLKNKKEPDLKKRFEKIVYEVLFPENELTVQDIEGLSLQQGSLVPFMNSLKYLSTRKDEIRIAFCEMGDHFKNYLIEEFTTFQNAGLIQSGNIEFIVNYLLIIKDGLEQFRYLYPHEENKIAYMRDKVIKQIIEGEDFFTNTAPPSIKA